MRLVLVFLSGALCRGVPWLAVIFLDPELASSYKDALLLAAGRPATVMDRQCWSDAIPYTLGSRFVASSPCVVRAGRRRVSELCTLSPLSLPLFPSALPMARSFDFFGGPSLAFFNRHASWPMAPTANFGPSLQSRPRLHPVRSRHPHGGAH